MNAFVQSPSEGASQSRSASPYRFSLRRIFLLLTLCALALWGFAPQRMPPRGPWFIRSGMPPKQVLEVAGKPHERRELQNDQQEWRYRRPEGGMFYVKFRAGTVWFVMFI
jgi:hypothetical protein